MKEKREGLHPGSVRKPLPDVIESDLPVIEAAAAEIDAAIAKFR